MPRPSTESWSKTRQMWTMLNRTQKHLMPWCHGRTALSLPKGKTTRAASLPIQFWLFEANRAKPVSACKANTNTNRVRKGMKPARRLGPMATLPSTWGCRMSTLRVSTTSASHRFEVGMNPFQLA